MARKQNLRGHKISYVAFARTNQVANNSFSDAFRKIATSTSARFVIGSAIQNQTGVRTHRYANAYAAEM